MRSLLLLLPLLLAGLLPASEASTAAAARWPMDIATPEGVATLYQPQPECGGRRPASLLSDGWDPEDTVSRALFRAARARGSGAVAD